MEQVNASPVCASTVASLGDDALLQTQRGIAGVHRELDRQAAVCAAEVSRRADRRLGREGLAWRNGHTNTAALLQVVTGASRAEATSMLTTGEMLDATQAADDNARLAEEQPGLHLPPEVCERPWFAAIADAVTTGALAVHVGSSIRRGLGEPTSTKRSVGVAPVDPADLVTADALASALPALIEHCRSLDPDRAWRASRDVRDELDSAGVRARGEAARAERFWRMHVKPTGMVAGSFLLDPEDGAAVHALWQNATHPKTKGATRWVSENELTRRRLINGDDRTTEQVAADALVSLLRAGASAPGSGVPMGGNGLVRLIATRDVADQPPTDANGIPAWRTGFGAIDGSHIAVPLESLDRHLCDGSVEVTFDQHGHPIDVGREDRLFNRRQRIALITRDGGCRWPDCDQPGEYCDAHHVLHYKRDHGPTEIRNGIMLCRRHHLFLHNHHWQIIARPRGEFELIPPASVDAHQRPVPMPPNSRIRPGPAGDPAPTLHSGGAERSQPPPRTG